MVHVKRCKRAIATRILYIYSSFLLHFFWSMTGPRPFSHPCKRSDTFLIPATASRAITLIPGAYYVLCAYANLYIP